MNVEMTKKYRLLKFDLDKEIEDNQDLLNIIKEIKEWLSSNIDKGSTRTSCDGIRGIDSVEDNTKLLQYILELELCRAKKKDNGIEIEPWSC